MDTAELNLYVNRGEDWAVQLFFVDEGDTPLKVVNPARMDVRNSAGVIQVSLTTSDLPPDFQTEVPEIALSSEIGLVQLYLKNEQTSPLLPGTYYYDIFGHVTDDDEYAGDQVVRLAKGRFYVDTRITESF